MKRLAPTLCLPLALACSSSTPDPDPVDAAAPTPTDAGDTTGGPDATVAEDAATPPACPEVGPEVVSLATDDGLQLEADLYTTGVAGGPAAVLLHMIPPSNTRANYPRAFIDALVAKGITVLNVDRRGAGGDPALARTAYTGPDGKWDAKAAVDFLTAHACAIDAGRIAIVGASNGTTTAFDYAVYAAGEASAPSPAALVFLTGGGYTETNNRIEDQRAVVDALPIDFVFSTAERGWSAPWQTGAAAGWQFHEYADGAHGTRMFGAEPDSVAQVADFVEAALAP